MAKPPFERIVRRFALVEHGRTTTCVDMFMASTDPDAAAAEARCLAGTSATARVSFHESEPLAPRRVVQLHRRSCGLSSTDEILLAAARGGTASNWRVTQRRSRADIEAGRDITLRGQLEGRAVRGRLTRRPNGRFALVVKDDVTGNVVSRRVVVLYDGPVIVGDSWIRDRETVVNEAMSVVSRELRGRPRSRLRSDRVIR